MRILSIVLLLLVVSGCTRIETGHKGVRTGFGGQVDLVELDTGWHQVLIGNVSNYVANEISLTIDDLHPQTKDKSAIKELTLGFTYSVSPDQLADVAVRFKGRDMYLQDGTVYPLGKYIGNVVSTATSDVFARYDALDANQQREAIRDDIKTQISVILKSDGLDTIIKIHQIFISQLAISDALQASAQTVITAQNAFKAKEFEVQTAGKEADRLSLLSKNANNIEYMNAKSLSDIAQGVLEGKVNTIVVPYDFKGIVNVGK